MIKIKTDRNREYIDIFMPRSIFRGIIRTPMTVKQRPITIKVDTYLMNIATNAAKTKQTKMNNT